VGKTPATGRDPVELLEFKTDETSHIKLKRETTCREKCVKKPCTTICPTEVYNWNHETATLDIQYPRCIECGACRVACPTGNLDWHYPRGGFGVAYRY